jgi:hypothetical protein
MASGLPPANLIIIDEGHQDVDRYVELLKLYPDAKVCHPHSDTGRDRKASRLCRLTTTIVEGCLNSELIGDGLLLPTTVYAPSEPNIQGVKIVSKGEFNQGQLGRAVKECTVFADVFNEWAPFADRKTVCFVPGVAYGNDLVEQFNRRLGAGQAYMIHAKTKPEEREEIALPLSLTVAPKFLSRLTCFGKGLTCPCCHAELICSLTLNSEATGKNSGASSVLMMAKVKLYGSTSPATIGASRTRTKTRSGRTGEETTQEAIERRRQEGKERQPLRCPKCRTAYTPSSSPPKCPACGCVIEGEPKRVVRMGNGKLKQIPAVAKKQREKTDAERKLGIWKSALFGGLRTGRSFHGCAAIYRNKTGEWPRDGWPGTFPKESLAWKRSVSDVLTPRDLAIQCSKVLKGCEK